MAQYKITRARFLDWYFSSSDDIFSFGLNCIGELKDFGKIEIKVQSLLDYCGYIPSYICIGQDDKDNFDISPSDVEFID
jgi:hypothetical protein